MSDYSYPGYTQHDLEEYKAYKAYKKYKRKYKALGGVEKIGNELYTYLKNKHLSQNVERVISDILGVAWKENAGAITILGDVISKLKEITKGTYTKDITYTTKEEPIEVLTITDPDFTQMKDILEMKE